MRNTSRLASLTLVCAVGITPNGAPMDDMFRMSAEENARRFYFDPERVKRRLEALAKADPRVLVRNRSTVVRLCLSGLRQSGACASGCTASTCRRC